VSAANAVTVNATSAIAPIVNLFRNDMNPISL
jgi:type VI protein secretion system component VasA